METMFAESYTANIFNAIFTCFTCVPLSTVISLYCLHLFAVPSTSGMNVKLIYSFLTVTSTLDCIREILVKCTLFICVPFQL